jgi:amino acid adenylation domain-containing protein
MRASVSSPCESPVPNLAAPATTSLDTPPLDSGPCLEAYLCRRVGQVLALSPERVDVDQPLTSQGLDSLMIMELKQRIEGDLKVAVPVDLFFQQLTINQLAAALRDRVASAAGLPDTAPQRGEVVREYPLSHGQQALWFLQQLDPGSTAYNLACAVRILSGLDVPALRRSLETLIRRHPLLRTRYTSRSGQPLQVIEDPPDAPLVEWDASPWTPEELRRRLNEEAHRPFDLERGPMLRVCLYHTAAGPVLLLVLHHVAADLWAFETFLDEFRVLYPAERAGLLSPLPPPAWHYGDYVRWQADMLAGPRGEQLAAYWRQQLAGDLPLLELPTDHPRPALQTFTGSAHTFKLDEVLTRRLNALAQAEGVTLYMVLLAAFQVLLHRYTGQEDVIVGSPLSGRTRPEFDEVFGYFVNPVPLRASPSGGLSFRDFLHQVGQIVLGALQHQDYPSSLLVEQLQWPRDPRRSTLFQVLFVLDKPHRLGVQGMTPFVLDELGARMDLGGLELESYPLDQRAAMFDLVLMVVEASGVPFASLQYNTDLFEQATIRRMAGHFRTLLEGIVDDPGRRLADLPLLTEAEQRQLGVERTHMPQAIHPGPCVHELFEAQAGRTPDAVAVVHAGNVLTYAEVNRRANQLAHHLRANGVGVETRVGLCLERSPEAVIAVLGVLKAGAAFVPLDPAFPRERRAALAQDAEVAVLVTKRPTGEFAGTRARVICLATDGPAIARQSQDDPAVRVSAENLAYVIYTSGTTGQPKGVMIEHGSLAGAYRDWEEAYRLRERVTTHLQMAGFCFDVFTGDMVRALCSGGKLVSCPQEFLLDPEQLYGLMVREGVDCAEFVPAVLRGLIDYLEQSGQSLDFLRLLAAGSDAWYAGEHRRVKRLCGPGTRVINSYGCTEATIDSTFFEGNLTDWPDNRPVPIGRAFPRTRTFVLDRHYQPVPLGVPGELHLGGPGVARGYLNCPGLTAEKFVADPFGGGVNARLYKTGDLARYLPDGTIELLGRTDHQVKLRGYRIEPGEIEGTLAEHPAVRKALVVAREDKPGDKRLVAYVVARQEPAPAGSDLRAFLKGKLPEYLIPSAFVPLAELPRTPNGKIDRRSLPAPDPTRGLQGISVAPRTPLEEALAAVWAKVLRLERVGVHDNFFELGGHSLQAVRLVANIRAATKREATVPLVFLHPTVASLAEALERAQPAAHSGGGVPSASGSEAPLAQGLSPFVTFERRPLHALVAEGEAAPVQAVALATLPAALVQYTGLSREELIRQACGSGPVVGNIYHTFLGRIATVLLPCFDDQAFQHPDVLRGMVREAGLLAGRLGARVVSLTGVLPSATDRGRTLTGWVDRQDGQRITTGQATTTAATVLAVGRILAEAGRDLAGERVGFLGLGPLGAAGLRLLLTCLSHPAEIILWDPYGQVDHLQAVRQEVVDDLGYQGPVRLLEGRGRVPSGFYDATLIVARTVNLPDLLGVERLLPGTLVVDDSNPPSFALREAARRFRERGDILFTAGDVLRSPQPLRQVVHVPPALEPLLEVLPRKVFQQFDPYHITGCVLSGLLSAGPPGLERTLGEVDRPTCLRHYDALTRLGFQGPALQVGDVFLNGEAVRSFRQRFAPVAARV